MTRTVEQLQREYDRLRAEVRRLAPTDPQGAERVRRRLGKGAQALDQAVRLRAGN